MNFTVTGVTVETKDLTSEQLKDIKIFSGKNAGICYMDDSYYNTNVTDPEKALKRFVNVINNGHHSIADHVRVEVLFEGVSKMLAIVLNSLQDYATSEKSGRYTTMTGNSKKECELYDKWNKIFEKRILELYPAINDEVLIGKCKKKFSDFNSDIKNGELVGISDEVYTYFKNNIITDNTLPSKKMAQENARYVLSVFTYSTTFGYSTSIRQWNYIYDWCMKYCNQYHPNLDENYAKVLAGGAGDVKIISKKTGVEASYFETRLYYDLLTLANYIKDTLYIPELRDNKNRCFEFLVQYAGNGEHPISSYDLSCFNLGSYTSDTFSSDDKLDLSYNVSYKASFVQIAQAERHRTLKYYMICNFEVPQLDFFVPPIIRGTQYEDIWLSDLKSIADIIPQATKVCIVEMGSISDFLLKCEERLCGRVQWEVMNQTRITAQRFIDDANSGKITNKACLAYIDKFSDGKYPLTKCQMIDCKESCMHGVKFALNRLI